MTVPQKRLVIVGATGMVGGYALRYALDHRAVGAATAIGRKPTGLSHPKLKEVLHQDFADCSALAAALSDQDAAIFCLGTYTGAVPDAELRRVTVDYAVEFARVFRASSPNATFAFLSGSGADPTGRSRIAFARYKGEAENALSAAGFPRLYILRPAYIYPVQPRREPNFGYRLLRAIYPAFRVLFPNQVIRADDLARTMVDVATGGTEKAELWFSRTVTSGISRSVQLGRDDQLAGFGFANLRRLGAASRGPDTSHIAKPPVLLPVGTCVREIARVIAVDYCVATATPFAAFAMRSATARGCDT